MPRILDPGTGVERDVDSAQFRQMVELGNAPIFRARLDGDRGIRLWDMVDNAWTGLLPTKFVYQTYLRKVLMKCSACYYMNAYQNTLDKHLVKVREQAASHKEAGVEQAVGATGIHFVCTGCGMPASDRASVTRHINEVREAEAKHRTAQPVMMLRYRLEPPEPSSPLLTLAGSAHGKNGAVTSQPVESQAVRPRRRRRRHRRVVHGVG